MKRFITAASLCIALILLLTARAEQCARTTPFAPDLIGKSFSSTGECYRPGAQNRLSIYAKMTVLRINEGIRFFNCPETYLIRYRTPNVTPMIIRWPTLETPSFIHSSADSHKWCLRNQRKNRVEMFPVHSTRANFTNAVKEISPLLKEIRDFGCELDENGLWTRIEGRAFVNADVQAVITYLDTVAFSYSLCTRT